MLLAIFVTLVTRSLATRCGFVYMETTKLLYNISNEVQKVRTDLLINVNLCWTAIDRNIHRFTEVCNLVAMTTKQLPSTLT